MVKTLSTTKSPYLLPFQSRFLANLTRKKLENAYEEEKKHQNNQNIEEDNLNNPAEFCIINREIGSFFDF